ncbi:MAG TPA: glycine cleavage system aminomethyltransferase GcvT [Thermoplasmata archaeon]|nr:glycine cleavage system aminomethyltransferase GcvT [Thermoplasmata archaeon]
MSAVATPPPPAVPLARTPLFDFHRRHGAHLVPFAGWEMPLYYTGIVAEHEAVRSGVGLFDVSHMGLLTVSGGRAADLLARRTTANVPTLVPGQARYTFLLEATGKIVDDLLITRLDDGTTLDRSFLTVPNAARAAEIEEILRQHRMPDTTIARWNGRAALLAVQGPRSRALLERTFGWSLAGLGFYHAAWFPADAAAEPRPGRLGPLLPDALDALVFVSRTGYTGELGFELLVRADRADATAERIVAAGAVPVGLGARDTLRLEKGFLLSGQEFHRDRSPLEAGQERFVDFDHVFVGRPALEQERAEGTAERLVGLEVGAEGAVPRHGTVVRVGDVTTPATSGGMSFGLHRGIALAYLPRAAATPGTPVTFEIRGRTVPGTVVPLPFVRARPATL